MPNNMNAYSTKIQAEMSKNTVKEELKLIQAKYKLQVWIRVSVITSNKKLLSKINL